MRYNIPYYCPILVPRLCLSAYICPCYLASAIYARLFDHSHFSLFAFIFLPFSVYGIRRFVIEQMDYDEDYETSAAKSCCFCNALAQDINEMKVRKIGVFKFEDEPDLDNSGV